MKLMSKPVKLLSLVVVCACTLLAINFGMRASFGFFMAPISSEFGYGRESFCILFSPTKPLLGFIRNLLQGPLPIVLALLSPFIWAQ